MVEQTGLDRIALQRLLFRCCGQFLSDAYRLLSHRFGGSVTRGCVFLAVAQASRTGVGAGEDHSLAGTSALAISHSLLIPRETVRRLAGDLVEAGWLLRPVRDRLAAAPSPAQQAMLEEDAGLLAQSLLKTVQLLIDLHYPPLADYPLAAIFEAPRSELVQRFETLLLQCAEAVTVGHGDILDGIYFTQLVLLNADPITADADLAWRYAQLSSPPPDPLLRAVSAREMADRMETPYPTARRRLERLVSLGRATRVCGGYLNVRAFQEGEPRLAAGARANQFFEAMLLGLKRGSEARVPQRSEATGGG